MRPNDHGSSWLGIVYEIQIQIQNHVTEESNIHIPAPCPIHYLINYLFPYV